MKIVEYGLVELDKTTDIPMFKDMGCDIDWHTDYYINGITATFGDFRVGFHNWIVSADVWIGDKQVQMTSMEDCRAVIKMMEAIITLNKSINKTTKKKEERMEHGIKIKQCHLIHIVEERKTFEVRLNDRDYQVGDTIHFLPLTDEDYDVYKIKSPIGCYEITYIHTGLGVQEGYAILGIKPKEEL